jgi:hypothetical protein
MHRRARAAEEDVTFLAGWMYADLFLALMVVFLATISFVPTYFGSSAGSSINAEYNYTKTYGTPLVTVYNEFNANRIEADITNFLKSKNLPLTSDVVYAQIVGGYDKKRESSGQGIQRALAFSRQIDLAQLPLLSNVATSLGASSSIAPGQVAVKFSFAVAVGVGSAP